MHYRQSYMNKMHAIANGDPAASPFFQPFQYFARTLLTQLKPHIKVLRADGEKSRACAQSCRLSPCALP